MKNEFMLYIRNAGDAKAALAAEEHFAFIKQCEIYTSRLKSAGPINRRPANCPEGIYYFKRRKWLEKNCSRSDKRSTGRLLSY